MLGWPRVEVGSASRETELVCATPDAVTWARAVATIVGDPRAMLSVVARDAAAYAEDLPPGVRVDRDDETLMTRRLVAGQAPSESAPPTGYEVQTEEVGGRFAVHLVVDESVAAGGTVGVLGGDAAYDAVETQPRHRRQGLARWVLAALDAYAVAHGATTGLLVATPDGARLYRSLGWETVAPMRSLMGVGSD